MVKGPAPSLRNASPIQRDLSVEALAKSEASGALELAAAFSSDRNWKIESK